MHGGGGHRNHLIRLIKVKESRIPTLKLINVNMADYETPSNIPQDRGVGGGVEEGAIATASGGVKGITNRLSGTHLDNYGNSSTNTGSGSSGKKNKKKEKLKIMKRVPNNNKHLNKNADSEKNKRKGKKNQSDKEKAYAEARARIFNTQESNSTASNLDISEHAVNSANSTINDTNGDVDSSAPALDSTISADSGSSDRNMSPVSSQLNNSSEIVVDEVVDDTTKNVPAAAKGGAESKVLWRNRQKEAIDPDFRRAPHPIMVQQPINGNMFGQPHYQPNQIMVQQPIAFSHTHGHGGHGGYHYQPAMDPMSYSRPGQHSYYQQPNDASWQRQDNASIHQMQNNVPYGVYTQHPYDDSTATNEERNNQNKQPPTYTEEEFPALA